VREEENKEDKRVDFFAFRSRDVKRLPDEVEAVATVVVDVLVEVHSALGPGHLEKVYEEAVCHELDLRGIPFQRQLKVDVFYKGKNVGHGFIDLVVDSKVILELKTVEQLSPTHRSQVGSYLAVTGLQLGILANFNHALMKDGIKRVIRSI
jgi:GxxExxY protein